MNDCGGCVDSVLGFCPKCGFPISMPGTTIAIPSPMGIVEASGVLDFWNDPSEDVYE